MIYLHPQLALDLANERSREAAERSRYRSSGPSAGRVALARTAAALSVGAAWLARRVDAGTADEILAREPCCSPA